MDPEEMKKLLDSVNKEAGSAAKVAFDSASEEQKKAFADLQKKVEGSNAETEKLGEQITKLSKAIEGISIKGDLGGGKKELAFDKGKMYRGMLSGNWQGADMEREIAQQVQQKAIEIGIGSAGGFAIPAEAQTEIIARIGERDILSTLGIFSINAMRARYEVPRVTGGASGFMIGEGETIGETGVTFGLTVLEPKYAAAMCYMSRQSVLAGDDALVRIVEDELVRGISETMFIQSFYGNGGTSPNGIFHQIPTAQSLATSATGDAPTKSFFRQLRSKVPQKYAGANMQFAMNEDVAYKIAALLESAAPEAAAVQSDEVLVRNALGKALQTTGLLRATKTKSTGTALADVFYGDWSQVMRAIWWGGLAIESSTTAGDNFKNHTMAVKAVLPFDVGLRRTDALSVAPYVQTINS